MSSWLQHVSSWGSEKQKQAYATVQYNLFITFIYLYASISVLMCIGNSGSKAKTFAHEICITYFSSMLRL